jgi:AcrR family transcriptional regulator
MPKSINQRQQIVDAALQLFAQRGYASTPVSMIAERANVSHGLMYNFFISKEDLLREIINQGFNDIRTSVQVYDDKSIAPQQAIEIHVTKTFEIIRQRTEFWRLLHTIRLQEKAAKPMKTIFREIIEFITDIFTNIFKTLGYKQPNLEALLFLSQIDGVVLLYLQDNTTPLDKLGKQIIQRYK